MRPKGLAKQQHYVPQLLLRGFADGPKNQVYAFDKQTDRVFRTSIRNVAGETGFYDIDVADGIATLEPGLARLEGEVAPLIDRIRSQRTLAGLSDQERAVIALFAMVQHQRTANFRARMAEMNAALADKFRKLGMDPSQIEGFKEFDAADTKRFSLEAISQAKEFVPHIMTKGWALLSAAPGTTFYIGDNPLTLQNVSNPGPRGGLGFAVPGIEIYLPISPELTMAWFSETLVADVTAVVEAARKAKIRRPIDAFRLDAVSEAPRRFVAAFERGEPMVGVEENTINLNSLQVGAAERYVFSMNDDFALVHSMISNNPGLRVGLRGKVS